jgi:RHS repeat-associated protein
MSFTYDAVGNRKERTDYNGALTDYTYDALNRLKTISYPDATTVSYTYDKLSRLQTATNENGTVNFDYNKMNRLIRPTDVFGQVVEYNYDPNGNRTKLSLNAAVVATYKYDAIDRVTKILDAAGLVFNFDYDATSKLTQKKAPNGIKTTYQYDGLDRLTRLLDAKGVATITDHQYQYNDASQITQIAEPTITKTYGYDPVDRLNSTIYSNPLIQPNENYSYDGVGNRMSSQLSASYGYQPFNRLTSTATATYSYDANGNLISKTDSSGTSQYTSDFENRLKQVTLPSGATVTYKYDALGRRIQRSPSSGVSTNFVYDGQDVVKDLNSDGSTVDYLNGPGIDNKLRFTDSRLTATGPLYFLQDHLGSTTALTNSLGVSISQMSYDAFGNSSGSSLTRYDYTGRERDPDTGLLYYRARWYDPQLGRFISEDPIGLEGGINSYSYVKNNPTQFMDPLGLTRCNRVLGILGGAMLGAGVGGIAGEGAMALGGAGLGTLVGGPPGTAIGLILGGSAGVPVSVVTAAGGAVVGGVAGYIICAKDDPKPQPRAVPTCDNPPKVTPMPPPPPPPGDKCTNAYEACLGWANQGSTAVERGLRRRLCGKAYRICKRGGVTVKFPDGTVVN